MPRPKKCRRVEFIPKIYYFIPSENPDNIHDEVVFTIEEVEALRLCDLENLSQEESAEKMNVSRGTFQRILNLSHQKAADVLVNGKAIKIEGGSYVREICAYRCSKCSCHWDNSDNNKNNACPKCGNTEIFCNNKTGHCSESNK